ncbi:hypothetical protein [Phenylobacterium sp.]|jgi:hypothetical protein|uniref:hypothetical protein n=1 Tax=Phenylobacterium sp. TaxID=1871053 RepID=UPI002F428D83
MRDAPVVGMVGLLETNTHLYIACAYPTCRRRVRLSAIGAVRLLGPATTVGEAVERLRCTGCGARGRDGFLTVWPCTLDLSAAAARWTYQRAIEGGEDRARAAAALAQSLDNLAKLLGSDGELGGDGPVQLPG